MNKVFFILMITVLRYTLLPLSSICAKNHVENISGKALLLSDTLPDVTTIGKHKEQNNIADSKRAKVFMPHFEQIEKPSKRKQKHWIKSQKKAFRNGEFSHYAVVDSFSFTDIPDYRKTSLRILQPTKVQFSDGTEGLFVIHSSHNNPQIGDITLLFTKEKVYINRGHVCGGIVHFEMENTLEVPCFKSFIDGFYSDADSVYFEKYKP